MNCPDLRDDLAAYAIGTLGVLDRDNVEEHLATCDDCSAIVDEFAPLPALLSRITAEDIENATVPVPDLVPRTLASHRARRRRRLVVVAAAVAVLGSGTATTVAMLRPSGPPPTVVVAATDAQSHVAATVSYSMTSSGTELWLHLTGVRPGEQCELIAQGPNGQQEVAATWQASYEGEAKVPGMTALRPADLRGFEIKTTDGRHLVWVAARSKT